MKYVAVAMAALALAGCGSSSRRPPVEVFPDMKRQARYKPQQENPFFADGRASRPPVPGTVARGIHPEPRPALTASLVARGRERYEIYCAACHDRTGSGQGIVATRAGWLAANLADGRIRELSDETLFDVITNGKRTMPAYRFQVSERDRWAVIAYVRALQRAAAGTLEDVPPELRSELR
jgi:mono/diheme cytochrome c family protein